MKLKSIPLLLLLPVLTLLVAGCSGGTAEPLPTYTPYPTYTPAPIPTPQVVIKEVVVTATPTAVPIPTPTLTPTTTLVPTATPTATPTPTQLPPTPTPTPLPVEVLIAKSLFANGVNVDGLVTPLIDNQCADVVVINNHDKIVSGTITLRWFDDKDVLWSEQQQRTSEIYPSDVYIGSCEFADVPNDARLEVSSDFQEHDSWPERFYSGFTPGWLAASGFGPLGNAGELDTYLDVLEEPNVDAAGVGVGSGNNGLGSPGSWVIVNTSETKNIGILACSNRKRSYVGAQYTPRQYGWFLPGHWVLDWEMKDYLNRWSEFYLPDVVQDYGSDGSHSLAIAERIISNNLAIAERIKDITYFELGGEYLGGSEAEGIKSDNGHGFWSVRTHDRYCYSGTIEPKRVLTFLIMERVYGPVTILGAWIWDADISRY